MKKSESAISARNLSKVYCLYDRPQDRLKQMFVGKRKKLYRDFWALKDISFDVGKGEALGIIGRNGAGKSTLLQILAGTLSPSVGEVSVKGRVACLLELGSGFNPEFTGRENVYLNGSILGFSRSEMDELFDEIGSFADIGEFMDQPVKLYSSGMYVRLAFAVQACVEPDVLIVDEALSVGDIFFQQKCHARIEKLLAKDTSVIIVSHAMGHISKYCTKAILLEKGEMLFKGEAAEAIRRYHTLELSPNSHALDHIFHHDGKKREITSKLLVKPDPTDKAFWPGRENLIEPPAASSIGDGWALCTGVALCDAEGEPCSGFRHGEKAYFYYEFEACRELLVPYGAVVISNNQNIVVHGKATFQYLAKSFESVPKGTRIRFMQCMALNLVPGQYVFDIVLDMMRPEDYERLEEMTVAEIQGSYFRLNQIHQAGTFHITAPTDKKVAWNHYGLVDLPGECNLSLCFPQEDETNEMDPSGGKV